MAHPYTYITLHYINIELNVVITEGTVGAGHVCEIFGSLTIIKIILFSGK
jgi:hypothetical protein